MTALHRRRFIDAHSDALLDVAPTRDLAGGATYVSRYLPGMEGADMDLVFLTVGGDFPLFASDLGLRDGLRESLALIDVLGREIKESDGRLGWVLEAEDVGHQEGIGVVAHIEGCGFLEGRASHLRILHALGVRSVGLTWNGANDLADGCGTGREAGLTSAGRSLLREAHRLGILIDIAHLSEKGAWETLDAVEDPIVASHCNARRLFDHPRNLADDLIREIGERGGVICATPLPDLLVPHGRQPTIGDLLDHIEHLADLVGPGSVGIGCDFVNLPQTMLQSAPVAEHRALLEREFPDAIRAADDLPNIAVGLHERGWADDDIDAVTGGSIRRLLRVVLGRHDLSGSGTMPRRLCPPAAQGDQDESA